MSILIRAAKRALVITLALAAVALVLLLIPGSDDATTTLPSLRPSGNEVRLNVLLFPAVFVVITAVIALVHFRRTRKNTVPV